MCFINLLVIREGETFRKVNKGDMTSQKKREKKGRNTNMLVLIHYFDKLAKYIIFENEKNIWKCYPRQIKSLLTAYSSRLCTVFCIPVVTTPGTMSYMYHRGILSFLYYIYI